MSTRSSQKKKAAKQTAPKHNVEDLLAVKKVIELLESGDFIGAQAMCEQILKRLPKLVFALHAMGMILQRQAKFSEADKYFDKALKLDPKNADYLTSKGNCQLALGQLDEAIQTFTEALSIDEDHKPARHGLANALLEKNDPEKSIVFFEDLVKRHPDSPAALANLGKAYIEARRFQDAITTLLKALEKKIDFSLAHTHMGEAFQGMNMLDEASECHKTALILDPNDIYTHLKAAETSIKRKEIKDATAHYEKLLEIAPNDPNSYAKLASHTYNHYNDYLKAMALFDKALELDPNHTLTHNNIGAVKQEYGDIEGATKHLLRSLELAPDYLTARHNLALVQLLQGNFVDGWKNHESRLHVKERKEVYMLIHGLFEHIPKWDGVTPLKGKSILLMHEQGYGDSIQFARYASLLAEQGVRVYLHTKDPLVRLFHSLSDKVTLIREKDPLPTCDYSYVLMSLPLAMGTDSVDKIPAPASYLHAPAALRQDWRTRISDITPGNPSFKVGIIWAGNPEHGNDLRRSIQLEKMLPLLRTPDVQFYSLQKGDDAVKQLATLPPDVKVIDLGSQFSDFADTAAAIENMDLVISVDTSVTHLSGAVGAKTWTLLPYVPDWRWLLAGDKSPWYPSMRLFRQEQRDDWESVIKRVKTELIALKDKAPATADHD